MGSIENIFVTHQCVNNRECHAHLLHIVSKTENSLINLLYYLAKNNKVLKLGKKFSLGAPINQKKCVILSSVRHF
jgi:hypothetical protein